MQINKSTIKQKYFHYDGIIFLDEKVKNYFEELCLLKSNKLKYLVILLDDRNYSLKDKNSIKAHLDILQLDVLMLTLKPYYKNIVNRKFKDFKIFRSAIRLNWILNCLEKYNINNVYLNIKVIKDLNYDYKNNLDLFIKLKKIINNKINSLNKKNKNILNCTFLRLINFLDYKKIVKNNIYFLNKKIKKKINKKFLLKNQISRVEENIFWIGFDKDFKDIPWDKKYQSTKWSKKFKKDKLLYQDKLQYCTRCCLPETMEGITFDEFGVCVPCRSSEEKMHINWRDKQTQLIKILNKFKKNKYYDCILPISGGKDSTFQAYLLDKVYKINPIAVTHGTNWMSLTGRYNLENCINKFNLDHLFFLPNRNIINKVAKKSPELIGDACWHCHIGTQSFPIQTAVKWRIPLMIYGESIAERDGRGSYKKILKPEEKYYYGLNISAKIEPIKYVDKSINYSEVQIWNYPSKQEMIESNIVYLHLGDYIFWDEQKQTEFIINQFSWKINNRVENTYKGYKSNECIMAGVHDYLNFIKRGVGRATLHASDDVRRGLIKRDEAINLIKDYDPQRPHALDYFLKITDLKEKNLENKIIATRKFSKFASKLNKLK
jgi:N-acetyl sugar amidotransferase